MSVALDQQTIWAAQPGGQMLALACPFEEICLEGPRGGGKSDVVLMKFAKYVGRDFGHAWQGVIFRLNFPDLADIITKSKKLFPRIFGDRATYNESKSQWTWPDGETLRFRYLQKASDYWHYHGQEIPFQVFEEGCNWPNFTDLWDLMRSCARTSTMGVPIIRIVTANPYGPGHPQVKAMWIDPAPAGKPWSIKVSIELDGKLVTKTITRVRVRLHWKENKKLLEADPMYPFRLAIDDNAARVKAWKDGNWDIVAGGRFAEVWNPDVHMIEPFKIPSSWHIDRSFDWGSSKPFSVGWWAESDGTGDTPRPMPAGTLVRIAEWYGWDHDPMGVGRPNKGAQLEDREVALGMKEREAAMLSTGLISIPVAPGPADSMIFHAETGKKSIHDEYKRHGVTFVPADKSPGSRIPGWKAIENRLKASLKERPEDPGLYAFNTCRDGYYRTLPALPRDEKKWDDVNTDAEDHCGDEVRYRVRHKVTKRGTTRWSI